MCNMLMKKHEDARELLVRAIVNNNALLMLNHPSFDEKISFHSQTFPCMLGLIVYKNVCFFNHQKHSIPSAVCYQPALQELLLKCCRFLATVLASLVLKWKFEQRNAYCVSSSMLHHYISCSLYPREHCIEIKLKQFPPDSYILKFFEHDLYSKILNIIGQ